MHKWTPAAVVAALMLLAFGCSGGGSPIVPAPESGSNQALTTQNSHSTQTHLWGFYEVHIDLETGQIDVVPLRHAMFAANVETFIGTKNIAFKINSTPAGPDYIEVDLDVTLTHPFPGLHQYDGFDVRGVFIGDGSVTAQWDSKLKYADPVADQYMSNADGYTRWWNPSEFTTPGVLGYKPGALATKGYAGDATLNPYKYFSDLIKATDDPADLLDQDEAWRFSAGAVNTRNYLLRFPTPSPGVSFNYAVLACWEDPGVSNPEIGDFPEAAHSDEAVYCSADFSQSTLYYLSETENGGNLKGEVRVWDWSFSTAGCETANAIIGTALLDSYEYTPIPKYLAAAHRCSTWEFDVPVDSVPSQEDQEVWLMIEYPDYDYTNEFGVPNPTDMLGAYFRFWVPVSSEIPSQPPTADIQQPNPNYATENRGYPVDGSGSSDPDGDPLTYAWDLNDDGVFGDATDDAWTEEGDSTLEAVTVLFQDHGDLDFHLQVDDGHGGQDSATATAHVYEHYGYYDRYGYTLPTQPESGYNNLWPAPGIDVTDDLCVMNLPAGPAVQIFRATGADYPPEGYVASRYTNNYTTFQDVIHEITFADMTNGRPWCFVDGLNNDGTATFMAGAWSADQPWIGDPNYISNPLYSTVAAYCDGCGTGGNGYNSNWLSASSPLGEARPWYVCVDATNGFTADNHLYILFVHDNTGWAGSNPGLPIGDYIIRRIAPPYDANAVEDTFRSRPLNTGTGDGEVNDSDPEHIRFAVDCDPQQGDVHYTELLFILDSEDDVEITDVDFWHKSPTPGDSAISYGTIPAEGFAGTPVDIETIPVAASGEVENRLVVLEDDGSGGWFLEVWNIDSLTDSTLLYASAPGTGEPYRVDLDGQTGDAHVFHDDGSGDVAVTVFLW